MIAILKRVGQFRRKADPVGQIVESIGALGNNSSANSRLGSYDPLAFELNLVTDATLDTLEDGDSIFDTPLHQEQFTQHEHQSEHYRCISELRFYDRREQLFDVDVALYVEHPKHKRLLPIARCVGDRRHTGNTVVWVSGFDDDPIVVPDSTMMYVSDEPNVAGKTYKEVEARYV